MNVGNVIVTTALQGKGGVKPFVTAGMGLDWLRSPEGGAVLKGEDKLAYQHLLEHYARHGRVNLDAFRKDHPSYRLDKGSWTHGEVLDETRAVIQRRILMELINAADELDDDVDAAVIQVLDQADRLRKGVLGTAGAAQMEMLNDPDFDSFIEDFVGEGIPFGIEEIDDDWGGAQPGQLITLVGRQKSTKSTLMAWAAIAAWDEGYELVFYNVELDMQFMRQKLLSIGAHVNPTRMRRGPSGRQEREIWEQEKERLRAFYDRLDNDGVPFRIAQKFSRFTVEDVARDIDAYQPHAVYIDGFYFMQDKEGKSASNDWAAIENIAGDLKALAMEKQVTIYVSTQAQEKQQGNKKQPGIQGKTIQGGTGLLKASDLVLGIDVDDDKVVWINQIHNRYGQVDTVKINWDWDKMKMSVVGSEFEFDDA